MAETRWLNEQEARAWRQFLVMSARLQRSLGAELQRDTGLSEGDYGVLVALSEAEDGRLRPSEIGGAIQWEKSRLSHHLSRMEQRGLVRRMPCKTDNRGALVAMTAAGRRALERAAPKHVDHVRRVFFDPLTPEQIVALGDIADSVLAQLEQCPQEPTDCDN
jgi:DNA-binding MarR family transcriptional regulator